MKRLLILCLPLLAGSVNEPLAGGTPIAGAWITRNPFPDGCFLEGATLHLGVPETRVVAPP